MKFLFKVGMAAVILSVLVHFFGPQLKPHIVPAPLNDDENVGGDH